MTQPGDLYPTWFSGRDDGMSIVLAVLPYDGRYPQRFNATLLLTSAHTDSGTLQMAVKLAG